MLKMRIKLALTAGEIIENYYLPGQVKTRGFGYLCQIVIYGYIFFTLVTGGKMPFQSCISV
jgi:hypothetical protein